MKEIGEKSDFNKSPEQVTVNSRQTTIILKIEEMLAVRELTGQGCLSKKL